MAIDPEKVFGKLSPKSGDSFGGNMLGKGFGARYLADLTHSINIVFAAD
jgi:hypothetical protein